jgi:tetratricopeptide (TPR) repeat protein
VSEPLFEQYKAALRRGHLAALGARFDEALEAYGEAARLVPERPLPFASRGTILHRLNRWPEAAEAFDQALRIAPEDEATLRTRAVAREERGMLSGAADDFERLAFILDVAARGPAAIEAAQKAVALESNPARVALVERLANAAARATTRHSDAALAAGAADGAEVDTAADATGTPSATGAAGPATAAGDEPGFGDDDLPPRLRIVPETDAEAARHAQTDDPAASWPRLDMPTPTPALEGPAPDPDALLNEAAELTEAGNLEAAAERMLTAVLVHRAAGRLDAALDICLQLLSIAPGDPNVHLAIANLQLDHGWTPLAREKIELLLRLTVLTGDTQAEADVRGLAAERLRDEPEPVRAGR